MNEKKSNSSDSGCSIVVILIIVGVVLYFMFRSDSTNPISTNSVSQVLELSCRNSYMDSKTAVLQIKNISSYDISGITLEYLNQDNQNKSSYNVGTIKSGTQEEIGYFESGWMIEPNEVVTIEASGYDSVALYFWNDKNGNLIYSTGYGKKKLGQFIRKMQNVLE